jgi:hypothetical protein
MRGAPIISHSPTLLVCSYPAFVKAGAIGSRCWRVGRTVYAGSQDHLDRGGSRIGWTTISAQGHVTPPIPFSANVTGWSRLSSKHNPRHPTHKLYSKEFVNQKNLDQLTHLLIETGLLPKMLEKLMAAYHPPFTSSQSQDQTGVISSNLGLSANDLPSPQQLLAPLTETHPTIPQQSVLSPVTPPIRQQPVDARWQHATHAIDCLVSSMTAQMLGYPQGPTDSKRRCWCVGHGFADGD